MTAAERPSAPPIFSLIVCTLGRSVQLTQLLESLSAQACQSFEVILVDQNQSGFLDGVLSPFWGSFRIRHVHSAPGLSKGRNVGLKLARGSIIAFPDDDCWYPCDLLERLAWLFREKPEWSAITGRLKDPQNPKGFRWFGNKSEPVSLDNHWKRCSSVTLFFRRNVVEAVGEFNEKLGRGCATGMTSAEESDYLIRALVRSFTVQYQPDLCIYHRFRPSRDPLQISRAYGDARGLGFVLKANHYSLRYRVRRVLRSGVVAIYHAFTGNAWGAFNALNSMRGIVSGWFEAKRLSAACGQCSSASGGADPWRGSPVDDSREGGGANPIRTLFVMSDLEGGGAELSLLELLGRLDRNLVAPKLFLVRCRGIHLDKIPGDLPSPTGWNGIGRLRTQLPFILPRALNQALRADVVVGAMECAPTYVAWLLAIVLRKPLIAWVKTDLDEYLKSLPSWHRSLSALVYRRCSAIVVPSPGSAESLQRVVHLDSPKLRVISNPVDPERVRALAQCSTDAHVRDLLPGPFLIAIGRLNNSQKGFDLLIRAHALAIDQGAAHHLMIVGEGPDRQALEALACSLRVEHSVIMPGFLSNPFSLLRKSLGLIAPYRLDGLSRVILEAFALAVPVVASRTSGASEMLNHGGFGILLDDDDVPSLARAMVTLLSDAQTHARLTQLSQARSSFYEPSRPARQWENLLLRTQHSWSSPLRQEERRNVCAPTPDRYGRAPES